MLWVRNLHAVFGGYRNVVVLFRLVVFRIDKGPQLMAVGDGFV